MPYKNINNSELKFFIANLSTPNMGKQQLLFYHYKKQEG